VRRLLRRLAAIVVLLSTANAAADMDTITLRGNYWRDRNTRVIAPEAEFNKELPSGTIVGGGYLLDAITSASAASGVSSDQPFTELRNQIGVHLGQRIRFPSRVIDDLTITGSYRYSTESDYWAHVGGGSLAASFFQHNTLLSLSYVYSHADVARRVPPSGFVLVGHLNSQFVIATLSQVLTPYLTGELSYEFTKNGDAGDPQSFQANPYRAVKVSGTPQLEVEPYQRDRQAATVGLRLAVPARMGILRYLIFNARYRFYHDDWGVTAHSPELRTYAELGPVELRLTGRWYTQSAATFFRGGPDGAAVYDAFVPCGDVKNHMCATGDSKLSAFQSMFLELRLTFPLRFLDFPKMPLGRIWRDALLAISYGHYINSGFAQIQYGNAEVGGLELLFPM
jgi:hypothetical protein